MSCRLAVTVLVHFGANQPKPVASRRDSDVVSLSRLTVEYRVGIVTRVPGVPFEHFIIRLPKHASAGHVYSEYQRLLLKTKDKLRDINGESGYNVVVVSEWLVLIPRVSKGHQAFSANAATMVGLIWFNSNERREEMLKLPLFDTLADLGIRPEENSSST